MTDDAIHGIYQYTLAQYFNTYENSNETEQHFQKRDASTELQWMNYTTGISHDTW